MAVAFSLAWAFVAGLVSFLSPCVLVLVPAFVSYLGGVSFSQASQEKGFNKQIFVNTLFYVLGFTVVFTLIGVLLNTTLYVIGQSARLWLARIGGLLIAFFGLFLIGLIKIPFLNAEHKLPVRRRAGHLTSFLFGMSFAVGWTPCVGAVLGSIFTLAAVQPGSATVLLFTYSLGLALPFLLVGAFFAHARRWIAVSIKYAKIINTIFGVLLVIVGILLAFNKLGLLAWFPGVGL